MQLYMFLDTTQLDADELNKAVSKLVPELQAWVSETDLQPIKYAGPLSIEGLSPNDSDAEDGIELAELDLGLRLDIKKAKHLKAPLNALYKMAQSYKCEFAVGVFDTDGEREDVCYFGFEEGKPDLYEIASYVGLN